MFFTRCGTPEGRRPSRASREVERINTRSDAPSATAIPAIRKRTSICVRRAAALLFQPLHFNLTVTAFDAIPFVTTCSVPEPVPSEIGRLKSADTTWVPVWTPILVKFDVGR